MHYRPFLRVVLITALILSIPAVAMQFTDEVNWDATDFVVMGALLLITGVALEIVAARLLRTSHKLIAACVVLAAFLYLWAELAVGIFTN